MRANFLFIKRTKFGQKLSLSKRKLRSERAVRVIDNTTRVVSHFLSMWEIFTLKSYYLKNLWKYKLPSSSLWLQSSSLEKKVWSVETLYLFVMAILFQKWLKLIYNSRLVSSSLTSDKFGWRWWNQTVSKFIFDLFYMHKLYAW